MFGDAKRDEGEVISMEGRIDRFNGILGLELIWRFPTVF
jgi:hypothetical protein